MCRQKIIKQIDPNFTEIRGPVWAFILHDLFVYLKGKGNEGNPKQIWNNDISDFFGYVWFIAGQYLW